MAEEEKKDEEASQGEKPSFVTIIFEAPGSAKIVKLHTGEISLAQVALAARELQHIADFEQWWGSYSARMAQMEEATRQKMEEEMIRRALMQGGKIAPN